MKTNKVECSKCLKEFSTTVFKRHFESCKGFNSCAVCGTKYLENKVTCSYACSNKHFRSGKDNGRYKHGGNYRTICFNHWEKKCFVCGEANIVTVHHLDEDHSNNDPTNLIPVCPTHHSYIHSKYKYLIQKALDAYVINRELA